ncbi:MT-A70 family methyltransferase [Sinorhizobium meliloti]|uniref:MT-A70 family methyltransferase n=1 Tax=Rhizobium meliloti TaxID=382 RepID=UPI0022772666|nr:MT-A70 family methyltransferase [Sinorhizobium meliloti]MDE4588513.1 hypothetical protein [Sinorhizobium meliloti]
MAEDDRRRQGSAWAPVTVSAPARLCSLAPSAIRSSPHVPPTIFDGIAREHSRKPDEFYALCDRVMPHARRADVFAREQRQGWHAFGNEVTKFDPEVAA